MVSACSVGRLSVETYLFRTGALAQTQDRNAFAASALQQQLCHLSGKALTAQKVGIRSLRVRGTRRPSENLIGKRRKE